MGTVIMLVLLAIIIPNVLVHLVLWLASRR